MQYNDENLTAQRMISGGTSSDQSEQTKSEGKRKFRVNAKDAYNNQLTTRQVIIIISSLSSAFLLWYVHCACVVIRTRKWFCMCDTTGKPFCVYLLETINVSHWFTSVGPFRCADGNRARNLHFSYQLHYVSAFSLLPTGVPLFSRTALILCIS